MPSIKAHEMQQLNVGDEVAVDEFPSCPRANFKFGNVVRTTKTLVEVKAGDDMWTFNKNTLTLSPKPPSSSRSELWTAQSARDYLARQEIKNELRVFYKSVRDELASISASDIMQSSTIDALRALADKIAIEKSRIESDN
jgi:hypothetical protein